MAITEETLAIAADVRRRMLDLTNAQVVALTRAWVDAWDALEAEFQDSLEQALQAGTTVPRAVLAKNKRLLAALEQARISLNQLALDAEALVGADVREAVLQAARAHVSMTATQLPSNAVQLGISLELPATKALDAIVARTVQQVHSRYLPLAADVEQAMKSELVRGVAVGNNPQATARRIIKQTGSRFNGGLARAVNISRTETLDAHRAGALAAAKQNEDVLAGWVWHTQLDARTCPSCISQHGQLHPVEDAGPLDHQMGRCARVDKTKTWRELGFDIDEPADQTQDARAWFDNLTEDTQRSIMGPTRLQLLQDGAISWEDLSTKRTTPGWRDSMHVTPVRDLIKTT